MHAEAQIGGLIGNPPSVMLVIWRLTWAAGFVPLLYSSLSSSISVSISLLLSTSLTHFYYYLFSQLFSTNRPNTTFNFKYYCDNQHFKSNEGLCNKLKGSACSVRDIESVHSWFTGPRNNLLLVSAFLVPLCLLHYIIIMKDMLFKLHFLLATWFVLVTITLSSLWA